ncbi:unnamed protein product [Lupinus luteus]|uniref:F-box protein n=1 Tax=Lupinus luteus TaxID=3873 RepID=A0AAV1WVA6_LUPLU
MATTKHEKESWTKIFTIGPLPFVSSPIEVWYRGKIFFKRDDGELYLFDLSTQVIEEIGINYQQDYSTYLAIAVYKECPLPIGGINS